MQVSLVVDHHNSSNSRKKKHLVIEINQNRTICLFAFHTSRSDEFFSEKNSGKSWTRPLRKPSQMTCDRVSGVTNCFTLSFFLELRIRMVKNNVG